MVLPFQHPLRIAEDAALVDVLSDGRLLLAMRREWDSMEHWVNSTTLLVDEVMPELADLNGTRH